MKKTFSLITALILIVLVIGGMKAARRNSLLEDGFSVLILYNPVLHKSQPGILRTYEKVLGEEKVPYQSVTPYVILSRDYKMVLQSKPVIIIPDSIAEVLSKDVKLWLINYILDGGDVLFVYDAGIKNRQGAYLKEGLFTEFLGFNYINYDIFGESTYTWGNIQFKDSENSEFFGIPEKFLDGDGFLMWYAKENFERIKSPVARIKKQNIPEENIYAYTITDEQEKYPAIVSASYGKGKLLYVNLPLGYLGVYLDELPLRAVLRTFLFKIADAPQLAP